MTRYLLVGLGVSGGATARALRERGEAVVLVEDRPTDVHRARAADLGLPLHEAPSDSELAALARDVDAAVPSPGVPASHPVFHLGVPLVGDVELAGRWLDVPVVAVTGTNGKTTVTRLVTEMLVASGLRAIAAGNIGVPMVDAVGQALDAVVAEVSSFQLALTSTFRPHVAVWLNLAEDHTDAHGSFGAYAAAKARVWANQAGDDLAVANADDHAVLAAAASAPARVETFGLLDPAADWRVVDRVLVGPGHVSLGEVDELPRALPHDVANSLAAAAAALGAGASVDGVRSALRSVTTLPHRMALVGEAGGVRWYDDSKATNPHAALAAVGGFSSVVLLAGGRNKGLDLSVLAAAAPSPVHAVVAFGEAADEVVGAFGPTGVPVSRAASMDAAVAAAAHLARAGDAVLLSPGCASWDAYPDYAARGDDFARAVTAHLAASGTAS